MKKEKNKEWNPPVSFYFLVEFAKKSEIFDAAFMDISGLTLELETREIEEGGETRFRHRIPVCQKHGNIICKRALYPLKESPLSKWVKRVMETDFSTNIETTNVFISLLNEKGNKVCGWFLTNLYPVKWSVNDFNSKTNELAIESIEFAFNTIERKL